MSTAMPPRGPVRFAIPPLENGDHLSRDEFERRSNAMPHIKAELLEGVVYMPAATRASYHSRPHQMIAALLTGLWVNPDDLIRQLMNSMLKTLNRGLASPEHAEFVKTLNYQSKP